MVGRAIALGLPQGLHRFLVALTAANQPQAPPELQAALVAITRHLDDYAARARLPRAVLKLDTNVHNLATKDRQEATLTLGGRLLAASRNGARAVLPFAPQTSQGNRVKRPCSRGRPLGMIGVDYPME